MPYLDEFAIVILQIRSISLTTIYKKQKSLLSPTQRLPNRIHHNSTDTLRRNKPPSPGWYFHRNPLPFPLSPSPSNQTLNTVTRAYVYILRTYLLEYGHGREQRERISDP